MALARTHAVALVGVQGHVVEIEADIENGLVALLLVGLPDTALREARDRIRSAIVNSGQAWPQRRITVGLSPASLPKCGSSFDIGIAIAILAAAGAVPAERLAGTVFVGELGLDGRLRPVPGVLPAVATAATSGFRRVVVPAQNVSEASLVPELQVVPAATLADLICWLRDGTEPPAVPNRVAPPDGVTPDGAAVGGAAAAVGPDLADVVGQPIARRAAEICAAGGHHLLLLGPPGVGNSMPGGH
jgi:magnesium chelatase family protein